MKNTLVIFKNKFDQNLNVGEKLCQVLADNGIIGACVYFLSFDDEIGFSNIINNFSGSVFVAGRPSFNIEECFLKNNINLVDNIYCEIENKKFIAYVENLCDFSSFINKFLQIFPVYWLKQDFKLFGVKTDDVLAVLEKISDEESGIFYNVFVEYGDIKATLFFNEKATKINSDSAIKKFILSFKNQIYADKDISLEGQLFELLKLRRLVLSTAESMTGGLIASKIISLSGASDYFYEGLVTYNTKSNYERLCVLEDTVKDNSVVSSQVAFEMIKGLLSTKNCDVAISVTGYASGNSDILGKCYVGIGTFSGVDVFEFKFDGTRNEIRQKTANAGLFLMIKKITNI